MNDKILPIIKTTPFVLWGATLLIIDNQSTVRTYLGNDLGVYVVALSVPVTALVSFFIIQYTNFQRKTGEKQGENNDQELSLSHSVFLPHTGLPGLDEQPLWWQITFACVLASAFIPLILFYLGVISQQFASDYGYLEMLWLIPLGLLGLHKGVKKDAQKNDQYTGGKAPDASVLSWKELLILIAFSTGVVLFFVWLSTVQEKISPYFLGSSAITLNSAFAFFFMRRNDNKLEDELSEINTTKLKTIVGVFVTFLGAMFALFLDTFLF